MPRISAFDGMIILMYWLDHNPPHFHVSYANRDIVILIDPPTISDGDLPAKLRRRVLAWATAHKDALLANWQKSQHGQPLDWIDPA